MKNGFKASLAICAFAIICVCSTGLARQDAKPREPQTAATQKRLADLQSQARRLQSRIEELRRKVDGPEKDQ